MGRIGALTVAAGIALAGASGCASKTTTVTTERVDCSQASVAYTCAGGDDTRVVTRETTVTREWEPGCDGVISCSFAAAGEVITLPFKIVGAAFDVIF